MKPEAHTEETGGARRPAAWVVGLIGLAMMVGGWKLMTYVPEAPHKSARREQRQRERLEELRAMADEARRRGEPGADRMADALHKFTPPVPTPQYKPQGQIVFYGGLVLFVVAGVLMYRHKPAPRPEEEP
jgi:hypothetical protein